ncbi:pilus assembly protein [Actinotalea solisilvae]|uniref:pilus assembly protein n=1 Tax=Actinotalea solisilvae TaxID=2072922 RepID=UPI0027DB58CE|nr:pilus assembly protein [Actinotalea solisilvae]
MSRAVRRLAGRLRDRARSAACADDGSAVVEFLGVALLLLVPTVYLVLVLGRLQSAAFAVDGAAREAVRGFVTAQDATDGARRATAAVALALADQGLDPGAAQDGLSLVCDGECLAPGAVVTAHVAVDVGLPGVPGWLQGVVPLVVPVTATATGAVDEHRAVG